MTSTRLAPRCKAGLIGDDHIVAEIGQVLLGEVPGRTSGDQITAYKSLGHPVQDLAAAAYIYRRSIHDNQLAT